MNPIQIAEQTANGNGVIHEYSNGSVVLFYPKVKGLPLPTYQRFASKEDANASMDRVYLALLCAIGH